ncbi:efflux RND transporter permease subunit [Ferrimonas marina]|uniref:Multidrug efflux pump subunit AcrB n=1 Tax=Ferrimonas marina TaxID=299255 RepID=A0A1M5R3Q5_9GAMM|nr:efflux RND transporter permease subunit [Ferrimonas marina]SHH20788.1 Multidrug efflux pump subunit AcrB [Ferrimonas marina]
MRITDYSLRNKVISWTVVLLLLVGGSLSFTNLGQLEFPEFPIPQALVNTPYPGASPEQVEEEVTLPLERALQRLEYIKHVTSISSAGLSQIMVELKDDYSADQQPQIWDELRRKVNDAQASLPPGVYPSEVNDDFSDVYGILFNVSGADYSYRELEDYAKILHRELSLVEGVKNVNIAGTVQQQVVLEIAQDKLTALGLDPSWIYGLIQTQNQVSNAGNMLIQGQSVRIHPTGEFASVEELAQLIVSPPGSSELVYLGDIAEISTAFEETPFNLYRSNGVPAISLGVSFAKGVNVVDVGAAIDARLAELENQRPLGMDLTKVNDQAKVVSKAVSEFLVSLAMAIAIVILVLLVTMGLRSGILMGAILLLTILGTFIGMNMLNIELELISLGALIIALGMLVDNAIVVTEGVLVGLQRGQSRLTAIKNVVNQQAMPLLGATVIAILAFAPIGLSSDATGDFMRSLFLVLLISLSLSWFLAITLTPFFCNLMFKEQAVTEGEQQDPYKGVLFRLYRASLMLALRHRMISLVLIIATLFGALAAFGQVKQQFFPPSTTPVFFVDVWMREGTDMRQNEQNMIKLEQELLAFEEVKNVTTVMGMGAQRFVLTYAPEMAYSSYAQLIVETDSLATIERMLPEVRSRLSENHPEFEYKFKLMENGPAPAARIEARFYGADPDVLRQLAAQAIAAMEQVPGAVDIRNNWREPAPIVRPQLDEAAARRSGISKQALDQALLVNFTGLTVGLYRDGSYLMPIVARAPESERFNADRVQDLQVWSQERNAFVPISQAVSGFTTEMEDPIIMRRNNKRVLTVLADVAPFADDTPESMRQKLRAGVEAIELPPGYTFEWGGEFEMANEANEAVFASVPMGYLAMFLITMLLFGTLRQPLAIWTTVPLSLIGIATGLLLLDVPFSFTALLGMLSLSGMVVKNGIVLVEQINIEASKEGNPIQTAIVDASVSRVRPVCMAALTTMLGMIPLLADAFFQSMAVTIIFGLGFATVLTLVVLPVIYSLLHRIRFDQPLAA